MLCSEIINIINKLAPEEFALEWDNVGLIIGDENQKINIYNEISKIHYCFDPAARCFDCRLAVLTAGRRLVKQFESVSYSRDYSFF